ncbi:MAG TPA: DUF4292 domain-containing protein [Bacteroidetes bacterium]|nr:DUF4292 domain-containing protein [Bacteroidota bacterium]
MRTRFPRLIRDEDRTTVQAIARAFFEENLQLKFNYPRFNNEVFVDPKTYDLRMMNTEDKILNQMLKITQSDFQSISGQSFAHTRNIQIIRNDTLYFDLVVKKIKLNEKLSFPFRISNKYEKAN